MIRFCFYALTLQLRNTFTSERLNQVHSDEHTNFEPKHSLNRSDTSCQTFSSLVKQLWVYLNFINFDTTSNKPTIKVFFKQLFL